MKLQTIKVITRIPKLTVLCKTDYGKVSVYWIGNVPSENETYNVEFETDELLVWHRDICVSDEQFTICDDKQRIKIVGNLETVDKDGYMVLRIDDSILTFMTQGIPIETGVRIQVGLKFIEAYPVEY